MPRRPISCALVAAALACASEGAPPAPAPSGTVRPSAVWEDPRLCEEAVRAGRSEVRDGDVLRVGTWNVRWFPDGKPGKTPNEDGGTDLAWLACALAWLDPDVMAINELKLVEHGVAALERVLARLGALTGATWAWAADGCHDLSKQHVGVIYRTDRVELSSVESRGEVDPTVNASKGTPQCPGLLRPALTAYVSSKRPGGADFHLAIVHLDSGREERDFGNRQAAWKGLDTLTTSRLQAQPDRDWIVVGDFNTMGCEKCGLKDARAEIEEMHARLGEHAVPLRVASRELQCTEYYRDRGTALDHIAVGAEMDEVKTAQARLSGLCAAISCRPASRKDTPILDRISDHCPVLIDVVDRDQDAPVSAPSPSSSPRPRRR